MRQRHSDTYLVIWETVRRIPRGKVTTYGAIAERAGFPGQARLVGYALHNLPHGSGVPWHRIVNAGRRISFPPESRSYQTQRRLLQKDGVIFRGERIQERFFIKPRSTRRIRSSSRKGSR